MQTDLACPEGLEPPTCCLEGSCSIRLSYGQRVSMLPAWVRGMVGAAGFELATYWSQTSCATRLRYAPKGTIVAMGCRRHGHGTGAAAIRSRQPAALSLLQLSP